MKTSARPRVLRRGSKAAGFPGITPGGSAWSPPTSILPVGSPIAMSSNARFVRLNVEQRAVVVLHFYLGMALKDAAEVLAIPEGTARSRLHYALRHPARGDRGRQPSGPIRGEARMTSDDRLVALLSDWLEDQPDRAPAPLLDAVLTDLQQAPQRARWRLAFTTLPVVSSSNWPALQVLRYGIVGGIGVLAVVFALALWAGGGIGPGAPSPTPSSTPSAPAATRPWTRFRPVPTCTTTTRSPMSRSSSRSPTAGSSRTAAGMCTTPTQSPGWASPALPSTRSTRMPAPGRRVSWSTLARPSTTWSKRCSTRLAQPPLSKAHSTSPSAATPDSAWT